MSRDASLLGRVSGAPPAPKPTTNPSSFTPAFTEELAQTQATSSSITIQSATASGPSPPKRSGMCTWKSAAGSASRASVGKPRRLVVHLGGVRQRDQAGHCLEPGAGRLSGISTEPAVVDRQESCASEQPPHEVVYLGMLYYIQSKSILDTGGKAKRSHG
jgi:hypothetical protein